MADRLNGYRILILETREEAQFSRLLAEQGADVLQCPQFDREIGGGKHHPHEEFFGLDVVELLGIQDVLPVMG